jgi:hypothetical protein
VWNEGEPGDLTWREPKETALSQTLQEPAGQRLLAAIDAIDQDVALVELWACALSGFAQPVPDYDAGEIPARFRLRK